MLALILAWFVQMQIRGRVTQPPHQEFLSSRQLARGSRSLPRTTFRVDADDGQTWMVAYTGEMDGQVTQGDYVVVYGHRRGYGTLVGTEIWLAGQIGVDGELHNVDPPVRIAKKRTLS